MIRTEVDAPIIPRRLFRLLVMLALIVAIPLGLLAACQSRLIYFPRPYDAGTATQWSEETRGRPVDFKTSQGNQRAFLQGNLKSARSLWIVCGGNGTVALDWSGWLLEHAPSEDACLIVDFPGYGDCEGHPSPAHIRESLRVVIPLATKSLGWSGPDPERLRFFGHSSGGAACLIAATEVKIQRGVLIAPFTSTMEMASEVTGLPLGFLVTHRFDNEARLAELGARGPGQVIIFHGTDDEAIPVEMSRKLANGREKTVRLIEIQGGRHNDITRSHPEQLIRALDSIGRP